MSVPDEIHAALLGADGLDIDTLDGSGSGDGAVLASTARAAEEAEAARLQLGLETLSMQEAFNALMTQLPTAAWSMLWATLSLVGVLVLIGKSLGGFRFVAVVLCSLTAAINFLMALAVVIIGYSLHIDAGSVLSVMDGDTEAAVGTVDSTTAAAREDLANFDSLRMKEVTLLSSVLYFSSFLAFSSLVGLVGSRFSDNSIGRIVLKVYGLLMLLLLLMYVSLLLVGTYFRGKMQELVDTNWEVIETRMADPYVMGSMARNMTQGEFVELVHSSFGFLDAVAGVSIAYISTALVAARFAASNPMKGALARGGDALMVGGVAAAGARVLNPMIGSDKEEDNE
eukprot:SAG31_NODE_2675_length_5267_cov_6.821594_3_plen_341_part_00